MKTILIGFFFGITFIVSSQEIQMSLEQRVDLARVAMEVSEPTRFDPLMLNAQIVFSDNKKQAALVIKVLMMDDWHIYSSVNNRSPFIAAEIKEDVTENGLKPITDWQLPNIEVYNEGAQVYIGSELYFIQYYAVEKELEKNTVLSAGLYYQACDPFQCFPPKTKKVELTIK